MTTPADEARVPAQRVDAAGRAHVDYAAVFALAGPLVANSALQAVLNLTDTWFIGRISTTALADLKLHEHHSIRLRVGIEEGARHPGGVNIFGRGFGNHDQDIVMRLHLKRRAA